MGLGVLVALTVFAYGYENGCQTAEILAINDEGEQPCSHVTWQWQPCNYSSADAILLAMVSVVYSVQMTNIGSWWRTTGACLASR